MTITTAAWMAWLGLSVILVQLVALATSAIGLNSIVATNIGIGVGMGWAAMTPRVVRWCSRRVRG